ncbi:tetratricopeptide repeat protein [Streptomyces sp. NPDC047000]|uniref:AfsR/SARP family transcriptional regulator n=1 Tax=Streptomyces sp. NPDC047000 TaxID=3155474 RepID=UPI0033CDB3A7
MELEIRLSGSVDIRTSGRRNDLGSTKTRLTLAALAWDADRSVSVDTLIHRVWDEHPPLKAREALHAHVSRVRRALRIAGGDAPVVLSRTNAYVLHIDPDLVDLRCYTSCVNQSRALRETDQEAALRLLDRADALWRGEPLAGISGSWPEHLRAAVKETTLGAAVIRADILISAGRFTDAVPVLLPLVEEHPLDEAMAERLAVALYGSSRTADATRLLHRTRQRVVRDIGLDAGRRLHRVHQGILQGTPARELLRNADAGEDGEGRGGGEVHVRPSGRAPDNLPRDVPWIGRRGELRRLDTVLGEAAAEAEAGGGDGPGVVISVEAIHGMGGVGKTSLAVHIGHRLRDRFPDGRLFVRLGRSAPDGTPRMPEQVLAELLRLLGKDTRKLLHETDLVAQWRLVCRDRRMLVILDDATDSEQVRPLLPGASPTAVIVTSRRRLPGLPGLRALTLDVLPRDDAIALFTRRLGARSGVSVEDMDGIVRVCGFLPLAVEIAANRLLARPSWTTADLLGQLTGGGGRLAELRDSERSLTHVFDLSYRSLNAEQRLVFRRVGLHHGVEFGPSAVAALTGLSVAAAERVLEELMAHHLISEPSPHRFAMHDLLRDHARSLIEAGDEDSAQDARAAVGALVAHYLAAADLADRSAYPQRARMSPEVRTVAPAALAGPVDPRSAEKWLITEGANLLDALHQVEERGTRRQWALAVHVLAGFLAMEGRPDTVEPLLRRALAHWDAQGDRMARARALLDLAAVHVHGSRYPEAVAEAREVLDIARSVSDTELEAQSVHQISVCLWQTGEYAQARSLLTGSLARLDGHEGRHLIARTRNMLGITHLHLAEHDAALGFFTAALADFAELGDARGRYTALNNLAEISKKMGDPQTAEHAYREAINVAEGLGSRRDHAVLHMNLASVLDMQGRTAEALALYDGALSVFRDIKDFRGEAIALHRIGRAHHTAGRSEQALAWHLKALTLARRIHAVGEEVDALYDLALAEQVTGRTAEAVAHLEESRSLSSHIGASDEEARAARALADARGSEPGHG